MLKLYPSEKYKNKLYNDNIQSVLYENPEEIEFEGYNWLTDTAVYYFILDFEEYDADLVEDSDDEEYIDEDEEELDFTGGFDFFEHCATIGVKLPQFDESLITYKG